MRALLVALACLLLAGGAAARTLEVGQGKAWSTPAAASAVARDGDRVEIFPGVYHECAIWRANDLVIEGVGDPSKVVIADQICEWKAIFVTKGSQITVRNLTLTRAHVVWGNAAGIRGEGQNLVVDGVQFIDNQNGILSGTVGGVMHIRNSTFVGNGACIQACAHGVYVGKLDRLVVEHSVFFRGHEGHYVKSRALRTEVIGCTIGDGADGTASYEIEAPNGGALLVRDNRIEKGPKTGNQETAISIGAEGVTNPTPDIVIEDNQFRNDFPFPTAFVTNLTTTPAILLRNTFIGPVTPLRGKGDVVPP